MDDVFLVNSMKPDSRRSYLSYHTPVNRGGIEVDAFDIGVYDDISHGCFRGGECGGLLFFYIGGEDERILICNPSTKEVKFLPQSKVSDPLLGDVFVAFGFGYDESSQDFKILRIFQRDADPYVFKDDDPMRAEMYSFRTNCWKEIPCPEGLYYLPSKSAAALVDGNLYWEANFFNGDDDNALLSFNLAAERFTLFPLPPTAKGRCKGGRLKEYVHDMFEFDGKLRAFVYEIRGRPGFILPLCYGAIKIWEWTPEQGSWVLAFRYRLSDDVVKPLALKHELLFLEVPTGGGEFTQLRVHNMCTTTSHDLEVYAVWREMEIFPYKPSTFPLPKHLLVSGVSRDWSREDDESGEDDESMEDDDSEEDDDESGEDW